MPIRNRNLGGLHRGTLFDTNLPASAIDEDIFTDQTLLEAGADGDLLLVLDVSEDPDAIKYITRSNMLSGYPSLTGSTDNTVVTVTGSDAMAGEANLTFDASTNILQIGASSNIEPRLDLLNDENSAQIGLANATDDMVTGSADGDLVINSVGDHNVIFAQNDTKAITLDTDGDVTFANNIDGGTWLGTTIAVAQGGTGATSLNNLITLTTHTTGNYVATVTGGTGIDSTAATSGEGTAHTLSVDLNEVGEVNIADGDYIAFMDATDSNATKKEAIADVASLFAGTGLTASSSVLNVDAAQTQITSVGTIGTGTWQGTAIASGYIAADAITAAKIADDAIGSEHIADDAVVTAAIADDAITSALLADDAVVTAAIADDAITSALIADDAVVAAAIADNAITMGTHTTGNYVATVTGGTGIDSTGATSGESIAHTLSLDLSELTDTAIAHGDYIVFTDTTDSNATVKGDLADVATLFAGTGLTASSSVIGVDASQTQITAVGTIATGTWAATDVAVAHGGTGASTATAGFDALSPMTAEGDILYGGSSGTVTKLAKGSDADVLTLASGVPSWAAPTVGDITAVTAGNGLSGGGTSGGLSLALDLSELTDTAIAHGDYIVFTDTTDSNASVKGDLADVATLFAGTGLTASSSVIGVDASQTQITAVGTIATGTWEGTTVAVAQGGTGATSLNNLITMGTHTAGNYVATVTAGTGLTSTGATSGESIAHSLSVDAAQTGITSIYATDLILGEDSETAIDFGTANEIDFKINNTTELTLDATSLHPTGDAGLDLGTASLEFKDAFFDGTVTSDAFAGPLTGNVTGTADVATVATTVTITDNESTNENNAVIFTAGGDLDGGNLGLESDGDLHYNPSTGLLSTTGVTASGTVTFGSLSDGSVTVTAWVDEDNMASDSATLIPTQQSVKAYVDDNVSTGSMSSFILEDDDGTEVSISNAKEVKIIGSGVTTNWTDTDNGTDADPYDMTITVDAAQTGITSIYATDLIMGEDAQTAIDFGTANEIDFKADNAARLTLDATTLYPVTDDQISLGTASLEFKDAFFDGTVTSDAFAGPLTGNVTGTADVATVATTVTITDNESTNENNAIIFTAGGDVDGGNIGLESDGDLTYNPSTGLLSSTGVTASGTMTFGSLSDGAITATAFVDEDNMSSDSATLIPTQQSVKAYVDSSTATGTTAGFAVAMAIAL